jgi:hypothetical protein
MVGGNLLLGAIFQHLPANPGLHIGVIQIKGSGLQLLWSARFYLKPPVLDRSPHFVSPGTIRFECMAPANTTYGPHPPHYVKITWCAHADAEQLSLTSRRTIKYPWGLGAGIVPSVHPALYAVGLSFKVISPIEVFVGAGIRKGHDTLCVYGITLDVEDLLGGLFGKVTNPQGQSAGTSAAYSEQTEQKSGTTSGSTTAPPGKKKDKDKKEHG